MLFYSPFAFYVNLYYNIIYLLHGGIYMNNSFISAVRKLGTRPLEYRPNMWKHYINCGCYPYAIDLRLDSFHLVGDFIQERCTEHVSDIKLISTLIKELNEFGFSVNPCETSLIVTQNQFKIYLQRNDLTGYYHFLRQDSNGIWSHKFPFEPPTQLDSIGQLIEDPDCMVDAPFSGWCFVLEKKRVY